MLGLYTGASLQNLSELSCQPLYSEGPTGRFLWPVDTRQSYYLRIAALSPDATGRFNLRAYVEGTGGQLFRLRPSGGSIELSWQAGPPANAYSVARLGSSGLATLPNSGPLPGTASSYSDTAADPGLNCYALLSTPLTGGISNSDVLCVALNTHAPAEPLADVTIRLISSNSLAVRLATGCHAQRCAVLVLGSGGMYSSLDNQNGIEFVGLPVEGPTCFSVLSLAGSSVVGNTDIMCAVPRMARLGSIPLYTPTPTATPRTPTPTPTRTPVPLGTLIATVPVGQSPVAVAVNPTSRRAYVVNQGSNNLTVVDTAQLAVVTTIPVGNAPSGIAVNPTTNRVYVANSEDATVSVVDGATNTVLWTVPIPGRFPRVVVNPSTNRVYVSSTLAAPPGGAGRLTVFDEATGAIIAAIDVCGVAGLAVMPSLNKVYVFNNALGCPVSGGLMIIDGVTNTVATTVPVGFPANGLAVDSATGRVYIAYASGTLRVLSGTTGEQLGSIGIPTGAGALVINEQRSRAYITYAGLSGLVPNEITVLDLSNNTSVGAIRIGATAGGLNRTAIAVDPTTSRVYIATAAANTLTVVQD